MDQKTDSEKKINQQPIVVHNHCFSSINVKISYVNDRALNRSSVEVGDGSPQIVIAIHQVVTISCFSIVAGTIRPAE
jgi:hypothetical protein